VKKKFNKENLRGSWSPKEQARDRAGRWERIEKITRRADR
jgi:hypothetical protein